MMIAKSNQNLSLWSLEGGYQKEFTENDYPLRVFESGQKGALELVLTLDVKDYDFLCHQVDQTFTVSIAAPRDSVEHISESVLEMSESTVMTVRPKLKTTSKGVRKYGPIKRGCFLASERQLHFFKSYAEHSCEIECFSNFTKANLWMRTILSAKYEST